MLMFRQRRRNKLLSLKRLNPRAALSTSGAAKTEIDHFEHAQREDIIRELTPHVFIHLARSRTNSSGYRQKWSNDKEIHKILTNLLKEATKVGTPLPDVDHKLILQKTVEQLNEEEDEIGGYTVNAVTIQKGLDENQVKKLVDDYKKLYFKLKTTSTDEQKSELRTELTEKQKMDTADVTSFEELIESYPDVVDALVTEQIQNELKAEAEALTEYREISENVTQLGRGASLATFSKLLRESWESYLKPLEKDRKLIKQLKEIQVKQRCNILPAGRLLNEKRVSEGLPEITIPSPAVIAVYEELDNDRICSIVMHEMLNHAMIEASGFALTKVSSKIGKTIELQVHYKQIAASKEKWNELQRQYQSNKSTGMERALDVLARRSGDEVFDKKQKVEIGAHFVEKVLENVMLPEFITKTVQDGIGSRNLFRKVRKYKEVDGKRASAHPRLTIQTAEALYTYKEMFAEWANVSKLAHQPMLIPPRPWTAPMEGAYLKHEMNLVRAATKKQNQALMAADMPTVYHALDFLGSVPWRVNSDVLRVVLELWDNRNGGVACLPSRHDIPIPDELSVKDAQTEEDKQKAYQRTREIKRAVKTNMERFSLRCSTQYKINGALRFENRNIYFPYNIDFRGRAYPIPPHLNHIGDDLSRGMLRFAAGKELGENGLWWMHVHLANVYGQDKLPFDERVLWTESQMDNIVAVADDPLADSNPAGMWWLEAADPFQTLATCFDLVAAVRSPDPTKYISHLPVHQDGSCNGLQHYAALGKDQEGGFEVNLVPREKPGDVYTGVLKLVLARIDEDILNPESEGHKHACLLKGRVVRKTIKQSVMTSVYGVTLIGAKDQIYNRLKEIPEIEWQEPIEQHMSAVALYLAKLTMKSLGDLFVSARSIMDWMTKCAELISKEGQTVDWIAASGLPVLQPYRAKRSVTVNTIANNLSLLDNKESMPVMKSRQRTAFPPNFVHSLDATHMFLTALECRDNEITFASVHDSYWTHAGTMNQMNEAIRNQFVELYQRPLLEDMLEGFCLRFPNVVFPPVPRRGELNLEEVKNSKYFFA